MGRHSAPDDDSDVAVDDAPDGGVPDEGRTAVALAPGRRGRHSRDDDEAETGPIGGLGVIEDVFAEAPAEGAEVAADAPVAAHADPAPAEAITERIPPVRSPSPGPVDAPQLTAPLPGPPQLEAPDAPPALPPAPAQPSAAPARATGADLRLVRQHRDVLIWCAAALLLPFVAYVVALQITGHLASRTALIFLFAPLITAGVLVGLALDIGHRRHGRAASDGPPAPDGPPTPNGP
jgi:hypothetical protein